MEAAGGPADDGVTPVYLTASNLAHYLIGRGLVTAESVVDGDFVVVEAGRRNRNFKLIRDDSPGLFVKQVSNASDLGSVATLQREAAFYGLVRSRPAFASLARIMPKLVDYDPSTCSLLVELMTGGENLTEYHHRLDAFPEHVGEMIGRALGAYHSQTGRLLSEPVDHAIFPRQIPWILTLDPATLHPLTQFAAIGAVLVPALQQHPVLLHCVLALRYEWQFDSLIHGDMKWDNLLIKENGDAEPDFRIVDWELADLGDASWDVGAIFTAYLVYWLLTAFPAPAAGQQPSEQVKATAAAERLGRMQPALRVFWRTYAAARALGAEAAAAYLVRCMRFCAARLVLAAFEYLYGSPQMTPAVLTMLQVSQSIFLDPRKAAADLLGVQG